ncbi:hypothetical protein [Nocardioides sp. BYT-33-1]|uniref:hypothetical protein n=1 Tax=Nocardioides sp. BYT-33-1 TaxID=3416952 RepID=UPI003F52DE79
MSTILTAGIFLPLDSARADNPACPANFAPAVLHVSDGHVRGKACFRPDTDNWRFQDTYPDGWGVQLTVPTNDLSGSAYGHDTDGANNGWIAKNSNYPPGATLWPGICNFDYPTGVNYGCTVSSVVS